MELEKGFKPAMVTTELAIGLGLAVVALFLALALFYQPVTDMITSTNFKNMFNNNSDKTGYVYLNKDYTDSQVDVQLTGAQGLELLRKKANNKAIEVIEEDFSNSNPDAPSIAYLATALTVMTGEPNLCPYMDKNSIKHCDEDNLGGYKYKMSLGGNSLIISSVDAKGSTVYKTINLSLASLVSSVLGSITVPRDNDGYPTFTDTQKYNNIISITKQLISIIRKDVVLINVFTNFEDNSINNPQISLSTFKTSISNLFSSTIGTNLYTSYDNCKSYENGQRNPNTVGCTYRVSSNDYNNYIYWAKILATKINNATSIGEIQQIIETSFTDDIKTIIENDNYTGEKIVGEDNAFHTSSSELLNNEINNINKKYGINIALQKCTPKAETANLVEKTGQVLENIGTGISNTADDVATTVKDTVKEVKNDVKDAWDSLWD